MRSLLALAVWAGMAVAAQAHFLFIVPTGPNQARVIFSDSLRPDNPELLEKILQTKLFGHDKNGQHHDFQFKKTDEGLVFEFPNDVGIVCGSCDYGVFQRGDSPAMLLKYYMILARGEGEPPCWDCVPLQVKQEKPGVFVVEYQGKPLADAACVLMGPDGFKKQTKKTDGDGRATFDVGQMARGVYALRVGHTVNEPGEEKGKKYASTKLYTSYAFEHRDGTSSPPVVAEKKEDPEATKLLADARAARLLWNNFPGFTAKMTVNLNGKVFTGQVNVSEKGKVVFADLDENAQKWAKGVLGSAVSHRLGGAALETPCAFADQDQDHPLGRLILVLNDEMHSSYRIKDRQIMVVNRDMGGTRFSITMQENRWTEGGQYLPASYTVSTWDPKTGQLAKSEAHLQTWQRVGAFDLPKELRVITVTGEVKVNSLTLSDVKLAK